MPKRPQKIEIEKYHTDLLLRFDQAVTKNDPNFLGTALLRKQEFTVLQCRPPSANSLCAPPIRISDCGGSSPLFLPLTRQRLVIRRDESRHWSF
jgi:hypothetical protein